MTPMYTRGLRVARLRHIGLVPERSVGRSCFPHFSHQQTSRNFAGARDRGLGTRARERGLDASPVTSKMNLGLSRAGLWGHYAEAGTVPEPLQPGSQSCSPKGAECQADLGLEDSTVSGTGGQRVRKACAALWMCALGNLERWELGPW